jgi:hypothetical protein
MDALPTDFAGLLTLLASKAGRKRQALADRLNHSYWEVAHWQRNRRIPPDAWGNVIRYAQAAGLFGVDEDYLFQLAERAADTAPPLFAKQVAAYKEEYRKDSAAHEVSE